MVVYEKVWGSGKDNFKKIVTFFFYFSSVSSMQNQYEETLLLTTKSPGIPGTHLINLRGVKGWVNLGAIHWF